MTWVVTRFMNHGGARRCIPRFCHEALPPTPFFTSRSKNNTHIFVHEDEEIYHTRAQPHTHMHARMHTHALSLSTASSPDTIQSDTQRGALGEQRDT